MTGPWTCGYEDDDIDARRNGGGWWRSTIRDERREVSRGVFMVFPGVLGVTFVGGCFLYEHNYPLPPHRRHPPFQTTPLARRLHRPHPHYPSNTHFLGSLFCFGARTPAYHPIPFLLRRLPSLHPASPFVRSQLPTLAFSPKKILPHSLSSHLLLPPFSFSHYESFPVVPSHNCYFRRLFPWSSSPPQASHATPIPIPTYIDVHSPPLFSTPTSHHTTPTPLPQLPCLPHSSLFLSPPLLFLHSAPYSAPSRLLPTPSSAIFPSINTPPSPSSLPVRTLSTTP